VNWLFPSTPAPKDQLQSRLMKLAALFLILCCIILTVVPAVRLHTWIANYRWEQWIGFAVWIVGFSVVYHQVNHYLPDRDPYLLPIVALLSGWGLMEIFRLNINLGFKQTAWLAASLLAIVLGLRIPQLFNILRRYKYVWLISGLLLALLTFLFGTYPGGTGPRLWLSIGSFYIQPSEFLKVLLIIYLSAYLADSLPAHFNLIQLLMPTLLLGGAALLILIAQRDLGTATLFIIIYTLIIYLASGKKRVLIFSFVGIVIALVAGYFLFDVIRLRVEAWINPWLDPSGRSYQIVQSLLAVANGGLFGRGIGLGSPGVVPVAQSDFIFSAICEEFGLAGAIALVIALAVLTIRGLGIALHAPNKFQRFLAAGVTSYLITQALLILGGTIRLLPLTGVTLPFISYGGSSLLTAFFSAYLLMLISNQSEDQPASIENGRSYLFVGTIFLLGLTMVAVLVGWWSMIRADGLLARTDNPRRAISDTFVLRGEILDRNNTVLAQSTGESGEYVRTLNYPNLSATVGYSNPDYGQTGIEASMDSYLRGISGNSTSTIWINHELYNQYPVGLNIRLSLDLEIQKKADELMQGQTGALILMNASSGEILAISNTPTFDANQLNTNWQSWMTDASAPLLNRATMGQYPAGGATSSFILANYLAKHSLPALTPSAEWTTLTGKSASCAEYPGNNPNWTTLISSGCTEAISRLLESTTSNDLTALYKSLGFSSQPKIQIETGAPVAIPSLANVSQYVTTDNLRLSPLQLAVAAAELTNGGQKVTPVLVTAYQSTDGNWNLLNSSATNQSIPNINAKKTVDLLVQGNTPVWKTVAQVVDNKKTVSWYVAGTPSNWQGVPFALVIALEDNTAAQAELIGNQLINEIIVHD
jgi:cell division protein FtsW (lipid II flippase)